MNLGAYALLAQRVRDELAGLTRLDISRLTYTRRDLATLLLVALIAASAGAALVRIAWATRQERNRIALPTLLPARGWALLASIRHLPLLVLLGGLPLLALALADPSETLAREDVSYPGRRIALLLDASSSMLAPFPAATLGAHAPNEAAFFTTVAAAQAFIRQRRTGQYRDLIALVEFGDEAYVVTPFTTDYDNVLLSASLIGDWGEFMHFPNQGTTLGTAIDRATGLFRAFDFTDASGNLMVLFTDGQDTQVMIGQTPVGEILAGAVAARIPVYMIRTSRGKTLGEVVPDSIWKPSVESTGGRFYAAASEADIVRAIADIDRRSPGTIRLTRYATNLPRFAPFGLAAAACWTIGLLLVLLVPHLRTFP